MGYSERPYGGLSKVDAAMNVTQKLARYISSVNFDDLPKSVVEKAKQCILDSIGCSLAGAKTRQGAAFLGVAGLASSGTGACTVIGGDMQTSPMEAAFCNAMTANVLEIDDTYDHPGSILFSHPGATAVPPALAITELVGCSGKRMIEAVVASYEVGLRVGVAVQPTYKRAMEQIWGCATFQTFGAAAAASKAMNLNYEQTLSALGIAGATAPVSSTLKVWRAERADLNNGYGWAAEAGIRAALLASRGFTGPGDILDGDNGFWRMFGSDQCDFDAFTDGLGEKYLISGVAFKPWPSCRWEHPVMDAGKLVVEKNKIALGTLGDIEKIKQVTVKTFSALLRSPYDNKSPTTLMESQFSTPFCAAAAMLGIDLEPGLFKDGKVTDPRLPALVSKIVLEVDPRAEERFPGKGGDALASGIEVQAEGGRYEEFVPCALGDPRNPWPQADMESRFLQTGRAGGRRKAKLEEAVAILRHLEDASSLKPLAGSLR